MIPKVIHYCWFGKGALSPLIKKCISSWKIFCPDYEIIEWNETNFDINICDWTSEAYDKKKYAFVSDYARLFILYNYGGIYLDTDIELTKNIDGFLVKEAFSGFENDVEVQTGIIGSVSGNTVIKQFLDSYNGCHFINEDGTIKNIPNTQIITKILQDYGLKLNNEFQDLNGFYIYPKTFFCPIDADGNRNFSKDTYCVHHFTSTWRSYEEQKKVAFMHKWYYPLYKIILTVLIASGKLLIGKHNARKLHIRYKQLFLRD
ncbi:glycosyltransferase [Neobacillus drentensis]|uniref:glycosyltransferase family 32 protein n=1 Tax=Neobacillus drentensis TaxID=220684 RepID=UPI002FFF3968